jgi:hypothetical protein
MMKLNRFSYSSYLCCEAGVKSGITDEITQRSVHCRHSPPPPPVVIFIGLLDVIDRVHCISLSQQSTTAVGSYTKPGTTYILTSATVSGDSHKEWCSVLFLAKLRHKIECVRLTSHIFISNWLKAIPGLNYSSTTPWRCMGMEDSSTLLNLLAKLRWLASHLYRF